MYVLIITYPICSGKVYVINTGLLSTILHMGYMYIPGAPFLKLS